MKTSKILSLRNLKYLLFLFIATEVTYKLMKSNNIKNIFVLKDFHLNSNLKHVTRKHLTKSKFFTRKKLDGDEFNVWRRVILSEKGFWNYRNLSVQEINKLSTLGRRLFLHEHIGVPKPKIYIIYVYKFGARLKARLINHYSDHENDPFQNCSAKNCRISTSHEDFDKADAVLFHLHLLPGPPKDLNRTNLNQRWVWMSDESIYHTFMIARDKDLNHYNNFFNWSMTYRMDSDVPVPYGRTIPLIAKSRFNSNNLDIFSKKNKTVAIMGSACTNRNGRWMYVKALEKYMKVDTYGGCGKYKCPGHFKKDCPLLNLYKFYLSFENSNCKDYVTEKAWWNAFEKEAVPVVMGTSKSNYEKLFPPNSFIHVEDFDSPQHLAKYISFLSNDREEYNKYHAWRSHFRVVNEHGYFQSNIFHYCRLCEALNYNSPLHKTYESMKAFWNVSRDCNSINFFTQNS